MAALLRVSATAILLLFVAAVSAQASTGIEAIDASAEAAGVLRLPSGGHGNITEPSNEVIHAAQDPREAVEAVAEPDPDHSRPGSAVEEELAEEPSSTDVREDKGKEKKEGQKEKKAKKHHHTEDGEEEEEKTKKRIHHHHHDEEKKESRDEEDGNDSDSDNEEEDESEKTAKRWRKAIVRSRSRRFHRHRHHEEEEDEQEKRGVMKWFRGIVNGF